MRPSPFLRQSLTALLTLAAACDSGFSRLSPPEETGPSVAYGLWSPGTSDTCTKAVHDAYSVVGPDGKRYPTWHPAVDPSGCTFGHEHGRDPRGSRLYAEVGPIPFGLANEALETWDPQNPRREDHVGHKLDWENDVEMVREDGVTGAIFTVKCDVIAKLHQGTHSKDAFTNNLHELVYHIRCSDRTELHVTMMTAIGEAGGFTRTCDGTRVDVGTPVPANSPDGGGQRRVPDKDCVDQFVRAAANGQRADYSRALHESWETSNVIRTASGRTLAHFNPYFQVFSPSRYYDPAAPNLVGRPIAVCDSLDPSRNRSNDLCDLSTADGTLTGLAFDDARSRFNGVRRFIDVNENDIDNADGPRVWYTDPFGRNAARDPFPGSVRQWIAPVHNDYGFRINGPVIGSERNYGHPSVHAPN